jgi:NADPH:quinone reductase-like Zn-dependent oxidoreductase
LKEAECLRALELQDDFGFQNLRLVERPRPEPGPGEILMRVSAASVNRRDLGVIAGKARNADRYRPPLTPLSDAAGVVADLGLQTTGWSVGDRVTARFFPDWLSGAPAPETMTGVMGGGSQGAAQDYIVLPAHAVSRTPSNLTDEEAATLPCAALTAWRAVVVECAMRPGETVLVQGTGGVSLFALQFAKAAGARVVITSSSDEKLRRAQAAGADLTVNYRTTPDWGAEVRRVTGGRGVDHVVEVGGAGGLDQSIEAVRFGGAIVLIGRLSDSPNGLAVPMIFSRNLRLFGITVGNRVQFEDMARAIEVADIHPVIDEISPLEDAPAALERTAAAGAFGKLVIRL